MKIKMRYFIFFVMFFASETYAIMTFQKTFGGSNFDEGMSVQQTTDGGYIITGYTESFGAGSYDVYLVKTDSSGDTLWTKTFGGSGDDKGNSVQQTKDGGYIIAGSTSSFGEGDSDVYLIKTNSSGDTLWTKTFGGNNKDCGYSVQQTMDGGYIITGYTYSYGAGYADVYLVKTDSSGDTLWTRTFGSSGYDYGYSVRQTQDSGYIITGNGVALIKTNSLGDTLWTRVIVVDFGNCGNSVQQTIDGGYIIAGTVECMNGWYTAVCLIKTDSSGDTLWTRRFGTYIYHYKNGYSVQQTKDGGYIIAGETQFENQDIMSPLNEYIIKTDSLGDTLWTNTFDKNSSGHSVQQTKDGGYVIAGWAYLDSVSARDVYLVKTDSSGSVGIEEKSNIKNPSTTLRASQNPFVKSTVISYQIPITGKVSLVIYDISGSCVKTLVDEDKEAGSYGITLNAKELKTGIYFVRLMAGNHKETKKLILMK
ncbi:MAG: T9SS type A sorting domain-containing protein [bacterium]|nr:T9SS type A sorting domain-containing protein [bacterium]